MTRYFFCVPFMILAVLGRGVAQDAVKKEINRLEGKYKQVSVKVGDKQLPENLVAQLRLVIKGDVFESPSISDKWPATKVTFKIDPSKNPKQIDFTTKDTKVMKCIYELSGNTLKIARPYGMDPSSGAFGATFGDRPKDFDSAQYIDVWERIKDE